MTFCDEDIAEHTKLHNAKHHSVTTRARISKDDLLKLQENNYKSPSKAPLLLYSVFYIGKASAQTLKEASLYSFGF